MLLVILFRIVRKGAGAIGSCLFFEPTNLKRIFDWKKTVITVSETTVSGLGSFLFDDLFIDVERRIDDVLRI